MNDSSKHFYFISHLEHYKTCTLGEGVGKVAILNRPRFKFSLANVVPLWFFLKLFLHYLWTWPRDYSLCYYVVRLLIMGRNVCLDCVALHFNSLWLQRDMLKLLSMENPNFPERLKTTATPVNWNYLLWRLITLVLSGKASLARHCCGDSPFGGCRPRVCSRCYCDFLVLVKAYTKLVPEII